jgi:hypothetical protein
MPGLEPWPGRELIATQVRVSTANLVSTERYGASTYCAAAVAGHYQRRSRANHTTNIGTRTRLLTCDDIEFAKVSGWQVEYVSVNSRDDRKRAGVTHAAHAIRTRTNPKAAPQSSPKCQVSGLHDKNASATNCTDAYRGEAKNFPVLPLSNTGFD